MINCQLDGTSNRLYKNESESCCTVELFEDNFLIYIGILTIEVIDKGRLQGKDDIVDIILSLYLH